MSSLKEIEKIAADGKYVALLNRRKVQKEESKKLWETEQIRRLK